MAVAAGRRDAWRHPVLPALAAAILFGASTPAAKLLLGHAGPAMMAALLYLGAGGGLGLWHLLRMRLGPRKEAPLRRADLPWLAAVILSGGVAGPLLLMSGLTRTDAASAALLLNLEGLATMAIAWLVLHESTDRRIMLGALAILAGAVLLSWQGEGRVNGGSGLIALACLAWGIDNNLTRRLSAADPVQLAAIKGLAAGGVNLALALGSGSALPPAPIVLASLGVGFLGYGASLTLFIAALRQLGTARTGAYFSLAPFMGALLSLSLPGQHVTLNLLIAGALMGVGLWLHLAERHEHEHAHEALEHEHRHTHDEHHQHAHGQADPPGEPHSHLHRHRPLLHRHPHFPDLHHRHRHGA